MSKIIFFILPITMFMILLLPLGSSFGPHSHNSLANVIFESDTPIGKMCGATEENKAAYRLGAEAGDLTVIYYWTEGGREYRLSHNWDFQQKVMAEALTDDEKCFAYGIASHLIADGIAHTEAVPEGIRNSKIPNFMSHPLLEKKYDSYYVLKHPELLSSTPHMMDALFGPKGDRYVEMIEEAMGETSEINVKDELVKLSYALDTFYEGQFRPRGQSWIFKAYPFVDKLTNWMAPVIGSTNSVKMDDYYTKSEEAILNVFQNWGARYTISPHGFTELAAADKQVGNTIYVIILLIIVFPIYLSYRKKNKRLLLLIPGLLILMVLITYILL